MWVSYYSHDPALTFELIYDAYMFIHLYPTHRQSRRIFGRCNSYGISKYVKIKYLFLVSEYILPVLQRMSLLVNEINWLDRLDHDNHCPHYPTQVTGICDTFPVQISQPDDSQMRSQCFNGKYGCCVVKVHVHD